MERDIKRILLTHVGTQNSFIDDKGHNCFSDLVAALSHYTMAFYAERVENTIEELTRKMPEDYEGNLGLNESYRMALGDFHEASVPKEHRRLID